MDNLIAESFIESASGVFSQMIGMPFEKGEIGCESKPSLGQNLLILIGLTGNVRGNVIMGFTSDLACKFAGTMMMMPVEQIDEMTQSAICELCNMIMGNAATALSQKNIIVDITPPTVLTGQNLQFRFEQSKLINIPLIFDGSNILNVNISYKGE